MSDPSGRGGHATLWGDRLSCCRDTAGAAQRYEFVLMFLFNVLVYDDDQDIVRLFGRMLQTVATRQRFRRLPWARRLALMRYHARMSCSGRDNADVDVDHPSNYARTIRCSAIFSDHRFCNGAAEAIGTR